MKQTSFLAGHLVGVCQNGRLFMCAVTPSTDDKKRALFTCLRRTPGHDSPVAHAKPGPNANMGQQTRKRRLISFIGGIDMCDGRYDTPRHSLFHTLATVHDTDFHQACIAGADISKGGTSAALRPPHPQAALALVPLVQLRASSDTCRVLCLMSNLVIIWHTLSSMPVPVRQSSCCLLLIWHL